MKRVTLVQPKITEAWNAIPLQLLSLASVVRDLTHAVVDVVDLNLHDFDHTPDFIGLGGMSRFFYRTKQTVVELHSRFPEAVIVLGGPHVTACTDDVLRELPYVYCIRGEGEQGLTAFVQTYGTGWLERIPRLSYAIECEIHHNPISPLLDLSVLPTPAWDLIDFEDYTSPPLYNDCPWTIDGIVLRNHIRVPISASRGCTGNCSFCYAPTMWEHKYRFRGVKSLMTELDLLYRRGIRHFDFVDDQLSGRPEQLVDLCQAIIDSEMKSAWSCEMRVDTCSEALCNKMREAGCYLVAMGIESGDEQVLKKLGKSITPHRSFEAFRAAHLAGLYTTALTMVGSPGETWESVEHTVSLLNSLSPNFVSIEEAVMVIPGTRLARQAKQMGCDSFWYTAELDFATISKMRSYILDNVHSKCWGQ